MAEKHRNHKHCVVIVKKKNFKKILKKQQQQNNYVLIKLYLNQKHNQLATDLQKSFAF